MNAITFTSQILVFCPPCCKLYIYIPQFQTNTSELPPPPPYIYICIFFSFHTLNMFLLSNLIYAEFNLTVLGEGNTTWYRATTFLKGNCSSSLKVFLIKNMQKYEWECYTIMYFRIKSMSFLSLKCHIGNDKTWSHFV